MYFLGLTNNRTNTLMYYISPKFLSINKMYVITSGDENSVGPDQQEAG